MASIALIVALLAAACGEGAASGTPGSGVLSPVVTQGSSAAASPAGSNSGAIATLGGALGPEIRFVEFTDWTRIRGTTAIPPDDASRVGLVRSLAGRANVDVIAKHAFTMLRDTWGWDYLDLAWEATFLSGPKVVRLLAFPAAFDISVVDHHLADLGSKEEDAGGAHVYTVPGTVDLVRTGDESMRQTAVLDERRLVVSSDSPDLLVATLGRLTGSAPSDARAGQLASLAASLGTVDGFLVDLDGSKCQGYAIEAGPSIAAVLGGTHAWQALAVGWDGGASPATARVLVAYADPATASSDLATRRDLVAASHTVQVVDSSAQDATEIFDLAVVRGPPNALDEQLLVTGVPFVGCASGGGS